jgi:hypothetical protein
MGIAANVKEVRVSVAGSAAHIEHFESISFLLRRRVDIQFDPYSHRFAPPADDEDLIAISEFLS